MKNFSVGDKVILRVNTEHHCVINRMSEDGDFADLLVVNNGTVRHLGVPTGNLKPDPESSEPAPAVCEYVEAVKITLAAMGLEAANAANHKALEAKKISLEQFQAAARVLAREILNR